METDLIFERPKIPSVWDLWVAKRLASQPPKHEVNYLLGYQSKWGYFKAEN